MLAAKCTSLGFTLQRAELFGDNIGRPQVNRITVCENLHFGSTLLEQTTWSHKVLI